MTNVPPAAPGRDALLRRVARLRTQISIGALRALTEGREPSELPDDELRHIIAVIERVLPRE